jgi:hypothetical protein
MRISAGWFGRSLIWRVTQAASTYPSASSMAESTALSTEPGRRSNEFVKWV